MSNPKPLYIQALEALRNRQMLFRIFIFTLVTVVFWIGFSIFFSQQKTKVAIDTQKHTEPLNPNINQEVLKELATRKSYTDQELIEFPIYDRIVDEDSLSRLIIAGSEAQETPTVSLDLLPEVASSSAENASGSAQTTQEDTLETELDASDGTLEASDSETL